MKGKVGSIIFGGILILLGVGYIGDLLAWWDGNILMENLWAIIIIVVGIGLIIKNGFHFWNVLIVLFGVWQIVSDLNIIPDKNRGKLFLAAGLIYAGIWMIFGYLFSKKDKVPVHHVANFSGSVDFNDAPNYTAIFGGVETKNTSKNLLSANVAAIFGGADLDFSEAVVNQDIEINVTTIFGGADIIAPRNVKLVVTGVPIFGGYDNVAPSLASGENAPTVHIKCTAIFGGVDIK